MVLKKFKEEIPKDRFSEALAKVDKLPHDNQVAFKACFGDDGKTYNCNVGTTTIKAANSAIKKILRMLNNPEYTPRKLASRDSEFIVIHQDLTTALDATKEEMVKLSKYAQAKKGIDCYDIMLEIYGNNLTSAPLVGIKKGDKNRKNRYSNGFAALKNALELIRQEKKLLRDIIGGTDEAYAKAISFLKTDVYFYILTTAFGENLDRPGNDAFLIPSQRKVYSRLIAKGQEIANAPVSIVTLKENIGCSDEYWPHIKKFISQNNQMYSVLKTIFGDSLEEAGLSLEQNSKLLAIKKNLIMEVDFLKKYYNKTIWQIVDCPEERKEDFISFLLKGDSSMLVVYQSFFGDSLKAPLNIDVADKYEKKAFANFIKLLRNSFQVYLNKRGATLLSTLGLEETDIDIIEAFRDSLNESTAQKFKAFFGDDLLGTAISSLEPIRNNIWHARKDIKEVKALKNKTLSEYYGISFELYEILMERIPRKSRRFIAGQQVYGQDLNGVFDVKGYFTLDGRSYTYFVQLITEIIAQIKAEMIEFYEKNEGKNLSEILGYGMEEIVGTINNMEQDDIKAFLCHIHGDYLLEPFASDDMQSSEKEKYFRIVNEVRVKLELSHCAVLPQLANYNYGLFKEAINIVPLEYRYVLPLALGIRDGICHTTSELAQIFNKSEEEIEYIIKRGRLFLDEIVAAYEKAYDRSFPNASQVDIGESRKRDKINKNN